MTVGLESPQALAQRLAAVLTRRGEKLAVAEGATGGALSSLLTDIPGSSAWLRVGIVAYTDFPKQLLLRVSSETIQEHGGIGAEATVQMARLARRVFATDWAVAITGYADDTAPTIDVRAQGVPARNPEGVELIDEPKSAPQAGLTYLAVAGWAEQPTEEHPDTHLWEERLLPATDRRTYKEEAAASAIELLLSTIEQAETAATTAPQPRARKGAAKKAASKKRSPKRRSQVSAKPRLVPKHAP
ncbi:MAG TPA: CinA family protein [Chloroflexota bacterium]|nr:CinA family protein [Chloroflexota bacterium]